MDSSDYCFKGLCWVCFAEKPDMYSVIDEKVEIDTEHSPTTLYDLLAYVSSPQIFYVGGPHLICKNCKLQAYEAYKFKKRCEISLKVFQRCNLLLTSKEDYVININVGIKNDDKLKKNEENSDLNRDVNIKEEYCLNYSSFTNKDGTEDKIHKIKLEEAQETNTDCILDVNIKKEHCSNDLVQKTKLEETQEINVNCGFKIKQLSKRKLKEHRIERNSKILHPCPHCDSKFANKSNLVVHIRRHKGIYPYVCEVCGKRFVYSTEMKSHKRIHSNLKPYKCKICDYSTHTSSTLLNHVRRHDGIKNHHCNECSYSACTRSELIRHMIKHSDTKDYICKICEKAFASVRNLKDHEQLHTGIKPYICKLCNRGFTRARALRSHLTNIHKSDDVQSYVGKATDKV